MNKFVKGLLFAGAAVAAPAVINNIIFANAEVIGNPLGGEARFWSSNSGDIFYTKQGHDKPPIVLLHGVYAGASIYEWRRNFDALGEHFTVYALDWLGFGLSDKPKLRYTPELYVEVLGSFLTHVVGEPCAIVASSLAGAYAVEAAHALPEQIEHLILINPTGLQRLAGGGDENSKELRYTLVSSPILGTSLYNAIASRAFTRNYLMNDVYFDPSYVTDEMVDHYSCATHQYGSQYAVQSFLGGQLDHSIAESLPAIKPKTLRIIWGREAKQTPLSDSEGFLAANGTAELTVIDKAGWLPHDEQPSIFNRIVTEALSAAAAGGEKKPKRRTAKTKTDDPEAAA